MIESLNYIDKKEINYLFEKLALSYKELYPDKPMAQKEALIKKLDCLYNKTEKAHGKEEEKNLLKSRIIKLKSRITNL